jgi:hypothetical protein
MAIESATSVVKGYQEKLASGNLEVAIASFHW